ncbi:membrane protein [Pedobacter antarcticus]|uniref:Membrane protein n=2 Tax=Pedobacter antarcticus TaxID=34086 RepID=A0A081PFK5_9SPHI|nr:membrane protein [Pedobacter antarcticus]KEQ29478.1 membrane protein [Pedobacter antarcticus 4BY]SDM19014.1 hypothetical protein SAMN04488084_104232 [Pedobacter antarcticus]SFF11500.1 hypothetical protein SAMN03003324_02455 [Pedobacter antarcticus]
MYKKINYITAVLVLLASISVNAQITSQSPYSRFGIGNLMGSPLPQFRAMGGVSTAINKPTGYNNINVQNPASYGGIRLTTIDVGLAGSIVNLSRGSDKSSSFNGTLSHLTIAMPITKKSAMSFGVMPYSQVGYDFAEKGTISSGSNTGNPATQNVSNIYTGEGGLTKAYIGYGYQIGDHLRIGGNVEYLFGNIIQDRRVEFEDPVAMATRLRNENSIGGVNFSYGIQYDIKLNSKTSLNFGYSGSSANDINSTRSYVASKYRIGSETDGTGNTTVESIDSLKSGKSSLRVPLTHNFGIALQRDNKWVIGADFRMGSWSKFSLNKVNQGLEDSYGVSVGGQITPDITSINSYFKRVDYRFGLSYDKSYIKLADKDVKEMALSFGLGLPLANALTTRAFYKVNFTTEIGKRGTMQANALQENFINLRLGFTLNDMWFRRFKFD